MRRFPAAGAGRLPAKLLLALTLFASVEGCNRDAPLGPNAVRQVAIVLFSDTLRPGETLQASAFALNRVGDIVDATVKWQSLTPSTLSVDAGGAMLALSPGVGIVRASVGNVVAQKQIQLVNPPVATLVTGVDSLSLVLPGVSTQVSVTPLDASGLAIVGATISWFSVSPRIASVSLQGVISPVAVGSTVVRVAAGGVTSEIFVRVAPAASATAPNIVSVTPTLIGPGTPFTIRGSQLKPATNGNAVYVDGRPAQLLTVTDSLITAILSEATLPCLPSADVAVQVTTSGGVGAIGARLQLAPQRNPAVGEALILTSASDIRCLELPGDGRYLVSVLNTARAVGAGTLNLTLDAQSGLGAPVSIQTPAIASARALNAQSDWAGRIEAHIELLEASRRAVATRRPAQTQPEIQVAPVGGLTAIRVPNLDAANLCTSFRPIHARTVYSGTNVYIVEDTSTLIGATPLLTGTMDAELQLLGQEIDNVIWPIISRFGDPLVMDSRLDDNDRVVIALTPEMNVMRGGAVFGAVVSCDFYTRAQWAASNVGEMLYLQVPSTTDIPAGDALARWRHTVRGTIAHELKHVVSFAEHIVRNLPLEEVWLEEATAQHAEELFARALTGATATGNTGYPTIRCEVLATLGDGNCAGTPALMKPTFDGLWDFLNASTLRSPLGATTAGDFSYYGSGWSLLRWAMDHAVTAEATFTQQLTVGSQSGVANLEARAGRSWEEMLGRWSLALATDGRAGVTPSAQTLQFPSWDIAGIFAGLCSDLGPCTGGPATSSRYTRAHPLQPLVTDGDFTLSISDLAAAGFQLVEVSPSGLGTRRLVRLSGPNGAPPPSTARLAILRIH